MFIYFLYFSFFWIDLIYFLCIKGKDYIGLSGKSDKGYILGKDKDNIWNEVEGLTEEEWNSKYNNIWKCNHCKYYCKSFLEFIPNFKPNVIPSDINEINYIMLYNNYS